MRNVPFQIREQLVPGAANGFISAEMLNSYLDKDKRKALVIQSVLLELETDIDIVVDLDEFFFQITSQELAAEGFLDDKDVKFKRKVTIKMVTSGITIWNQVWSWGCGRTCIITTEKFWLQFQTVGQAGATTVNVVLNCVMGFIDETTWNRITSPD